MEDFENFPYFFGVSVSLRIQKTNESFTLLSIFLNVALYMCREGLCCFTFHLISYYVDHPYSRRHRRFCLGAPLLPPDPIENRQIFSRFLILICISIHENKNSNKVSPENLLHIRIEQRFVLISNKFYVHNGNFPV